MSSQDILIGKCAYPPYKGEDHEATQIYLASHGGKKGALSALVQKAVSRYIIFSLTKETKEELRISGLSQDDLDKIIADGAAWTKGQPQ